MKGRSEVGVLVFLKKRLGFVELVVGLKGVFKIKLLMKDCLEGFLKRVVDIEKIERVE